MFDLLQLFNAILRQPHSLPTTVYKFYKILKLDKAGSTHHHYCSFCNQPIDTNSSLICPNPMCKCVFKKEQELPYFL